VVLSHVHGDHTGGIPRLLPRLKPATWYIPAGLADRLRPSLEKAGHSVVPVDEALPVCPGIFSSGQLGACPEREIEEIIAALRDLGVEKVTPSHCSGERCESGQIVRKDRSPPQPVRRCQRRTQAAFSALSRGWASATRIIRVRCRRQRPASRSR
jgi:metal-dependent hydrolase (beta-lactamase superfamily II)